ncbi:NAD(P)-binding domain-containing protein [Streptomyces sp. NPDC046931]|uniref:NAD(P)-binding domain-containing protein n=1 Tax=Streptomyces sp. NPDC046931 TaxID=3154806 RepID=UPI0033F51D38
MADTRSTPALIVGAGPFALSAAALARERGIDVDVVGQPMGFWNAHMPDGMLLRSGTDWHLDATGMHTLEAYLQEHGLKDDDVLPIPVEVFRAYAEWFSQAKQLSIRQEFVSSIARRDGGFEAVLTGGGRIHADIVIAVPGIGYFQHLPDWAAGVPASRAAHSCELVRFDALSGQRVLVVGGRQSAYEWAALMSEHGAARIDIVHRHPAPRFESVSWKFFDDYVDGTVHVEGWWRRLTAKEQGAITTRCWEAGRAVLEPWLPARLDPAVVHAWPQTEVVQADSGGSQDSVRVTLSNGESLTVEHILFATGYAPDLARVPYLSDLHSEIVTRNGFPMLDDHFQTSIPGLYFTGFAATQDFGPFFGFVRAAPASATILLRALQSHGM